MTACRAPRPTFAVGCSSSRGAAGTDVKRITRGPSAGTAPRRPRFAVRRYPDGYSVAANASWKSTAPDGSAPQNDSAIT